jgi:SAM-dependent methyltransferase
VDIITGDLYSAAEAAQVPEDALLASLGCGNPTALATLKEGEVVLDLGSGGGIDVLLSARRVGPSGFVYGLDMTDEMLALAEKNRATAGAENVRFLKGHIEEIPLADNTVDVIISNCVINLSADKDAVLREAFRVLKPGGRFAVSDVVVEGEIPDAVRKDMEAYVGCVAGALEKDDYIGRLAAAGFADAAIEPTRRYTFSDLEGSSCCSEGVLALPADEKAALDGRIMGAFIRAAKPNAIPGAEFAAPKRLEIFDPAMCCSTGVCGPQVAPALVRFAADVNWLKGKGVTVDRHNLGQSPAAFAANAVVLREIAADPESLPILVVDGKVVSRKTYPTRAELAALAGIAAPPAQISLNVRTA